MTYCSQCGTKLSDGAKICPQCGIATDSHIVYIQSPQQDIYVHSRKSKGLAMTLCFFGGWFGLHEFYLRNYLSGTLYLLFCWTFIPLFLSILDFVIMLFIPNSAFHKMYDK
ncbi:NINE protein [Prevotella communis]|uniref:TM2 domain-containing protein n=1 Tax=Prevotella communis TaxID=2913614 RepID=UPI003D6883D0